MSLTYKPPVKVHKFNRRYVLRDPLSKEVMEFQQNSNALDYEKRMVMTMQFIADLMNGRKSVKFHNGEYSIILHAEVPDAPAANPTIPGLMANAEQAQVERIIRDERLKEGELPPAATANKPTPITKAEPITPMFEEPVHEVIPEKKQPSIIEKVKEAVKKRGRPKKK